MKNNYQIRTDFADELITKKIQSKTYTHTEKQNDYVKSNYITILEEENELGKAKGEYVSIECVNIHDQQAREDMVCAVSESLHCMWDSTHQLLDKILVVGLGNRDITSDALGPNVASEILVTAHLYANDYKQSLKGTREVAVIQPGVMGQTGLESFAIVESIVQFYKPDLVIAIDALATRTLSRINRVVQINNTGIQPGSGVGNHRLALNEKTLHVPVIAIGVATVTSIGAILQDVLDTNNQTYLKKIKKQTPLDLIVTPKSIDDEMKQLVYIVSESINRFLHPSYRNL